jgi:glycosyltransferase involved in cell wall biosynthesis
MTVRVSVVIAPDNASTATVDAAVRSALVSDLHELEVLLVGHGVTTQFARLGETLRDNRLTTVLLRQGSGQVRARNVGIARSHASYVAFLDPADELKPDKLSSAVRALDENTHAGFAFSDFETIDTTGAVIRSSALSEVADSLAGIPLGGDWYRIPQPQLAPGLAERNLIGRSAMVVRRELLTEIGPFDELAGLCADLDLWLRLAHRCDALYCSRIGYSERLKPVDTNPAARLQEAADRIVVLHRERQRWADRRLRARLDRRIAEHLAASGYAERERRQRLRALAMFATAFATSPDVRWLHGMVRSLCP